MSHWKNDFGCTYEDEEEARESAFEFMDGADYAENLSASIPYDELLSWAMKQDNFWVDFEEQVREAEDNFFTDHYREIEEDEEEED